MFQINTLDKSSPKALYIQLYEAIKEKIIEKELDAGEMLPSKRAIASQLGLSLKTIENAYGQLDLEGFIYSVEKKGYFVSKLDNYIVPKSPKQAYVCKPEERKFDLDLTLTHSARQEFPFSAWTKLMREVITEEGEGIMSAGPFYGHPKLRSAIASYLEQFRGMKVSPDQIVIGPGIEYLYARLIRLLGPDMKYALEDPGTSKTRNFYSYYGIEYQPIPVDEDGLVIEYLNKTDCNIVHLNPARNYPLGFVTTAARRVELLFWANSAPNRYIIENEFDLELRYRGLPVPPIHSIDIRDKVIYLNNFSRSIAGILKIGYMVLPKDLMEKYVENETYATPTVSGYDQLLMAKYINDGHLERYYNHLKHYYGIMREQVLKLISGHSIASKTEVIENAAGTHVILKLDTDVPDDTFKNTFREHRINANFISDYCDLPNSQYRHMLLVNYSTASIEQLKEFFDLLNSLM